MKVGDEVLILETASGEEYNTYLGWNPDMECCVGTTGYVGCIDPDDDTAYVTFIEVPAGKDPPTYGGWWWRVEDLKVIPPSKWRRRDLGGSDESRR